MKLAELPVLYLTTKGRQTGLPREIEIWFVAWGGRLYLLAEHFRRAQWVRNIESHSRVQVRLGDRDLGAVARVLDPERDAEAWRTAQELARKKYGWGQGLPIQIIPDEPLEPAPASEHAATRRLPEGS